MACAIIFVEPIHLRGEMDRLFREECRPRNVPSPFSMFSEAPLVRSNSLQDFPIEKCSSFS